MPYSIIRPRAAGAVAAAALAFPAAAAAHVTIQPSTAAAGGFTRVDVRVPNEQENAGTTKIQVQLPPGFEFVSYEPRGGWKVDVKKSGDAVSEITWTGEGAQGVIAPGQFMDFGLSLKMPEGKAGDKLTFKALQTYDNGDVVRWIGPEDADEPAPQVTLTEAEGEAAHAAPAATSTPAAAPPASKDDDGSDGLTIAALVIGVLGLLAGATALVATRRDRVPA
jgi:uncharacterized protein YcnI